MHAAAWRNYKLIIAAGLVAMLVLLQSLFGIIPCSWTAKTPSAMCLCHLESRRIGTVDKALDDLPEHLSVMNQATKEETLVILLEVLQYDERSFPLDYVRLGQSSSTLSGGESQRVKLAFYLSHEKAGEHILFIFDEPTTGLHFHDINKLLISLNSLIEKGHSVVVIEHNPEIIKSADWVIDLGPEGGEEGGEVVFEGTPEELAGYRASYTGKYIRKKIRGNR